MAVLSLTQSAVRDLAKHDITVTGYVPAVVATGIWEEVDRDLMAIDASERRARQWRNSPRES